MLRVPYNPVIPAAQLDNWQLNLFSHVFLERRVARHPALLKTKPIKKQMNLLVGSMANLEQWGRQNLITVRSDNTASPVGRLPRLKSKVRTKGSPERKQWPRVCNRGEPSSRKKLAVVGLLV